MGVGDWCKSEDGRWVMLSDRLDTGELETVYNFTVEDYHTYYVGQPIWGFSLWAHNADGNYQQKRGKKIPTDELLEPPTKRGKPPVGKDGKPVELHHRGQKPKGPLDEMTREEHRGQGNFKKNHPNTGQSKSLIDRGKFREERQEYWEQEWDSGRFESLF